MHGRISPWWAWLLIAVAAAASPAQAQDGTLPYNDYEATDGPAPNNGPAYEPAYGSVYEPGYEPSPNPAPPSADDAVVPGTLISNPQASPDLARRLEALEQALKKRDEKDAAAAKEKSGKPTVNVGGVVQTDVAMFSQDAASRAQFPKGGTGSDGVRNGVEFRRARIKIDGEAFEVVHYAITADFAAAAAGNSVAFKDCFIGIKDLPLAGNLRVGHFKEPFGLDQLTGDRVITFMERSVSDDGAIVPGRNWGVMVSDWSESERMTWGIGAFVAQMPDNPPLFQENSAGWATTMRMSYLPWYDEESGGRGLIHTGAAYSFREAANNRLTLGSRPEAHLGPTVVDINGAGTLNDVDYSQLFGLETAMVYGSLSLQAEYFTDTVSFTDRGAAQINGCYGYVSYFLTGEHRPYNRRTGTFDRVKPLENFFRVRTCDGECANGLGAWEVAYRYSMLDLNSVDPRCGAVFDNTVGLNWYLNPHTRLMWNYVHSHVDRSKNGLTNSNMDIFEMRFAIDF